MQTTKQVTARELNNIINYNQLNEREEVLKSIMYSTFMEYQYKDHSLDSVGKQFYAYLQDLKDFVEKMEKRS